MLFFVGFSNCGKAREIFDLGESLGGLCVSCVKSVRARGFCEAICRMRFRRNMCKSKSSFYYMISNMFVLKLYMFAPPGMTGVITQGNGPCVIQVHRSGLESKIRQIDKLG